MPKVILQRLNNSDALFAAGKAVERWRRLTSRISNAALMGFAALASRISSGRLLI
jgi:hypothetical protein